MSPDEEILPAEPLPEATQVNKPRGIAPVWHTVVLILAIIGYSYWGAKEAELGANNPLAPIHQTASAGKQSTPQQPEGADPLRLLRYALSGGLELAIVAWVAVGLRIRKIPFRSLFGSLPRGLNDITKEAGIAAFFWCTAMAVLMIVAFSWLGVQTQIEKYEAKHAQHATPTAPGSKNTTKSAEQQQTEMVRQLMELAPSNGVEIAAWGVLCLIVGFSEELIFRGYLQTQSISLLHRIPLGVLVTSIIFGAAHGYQGIRGMCIITVFGAMFSGITLLRRNLFPGILAHTWHDFATGLFLALLRTSHLLDHLPAAK